MVEVLLYWKADTTAKDTGGRTALHCAEQNRKLGVARLIKGHQIQDLEPKPARETMPDQIVSPEAATGFIERMGRLALIRQQMVAGLGEEGLSGVSGGAALRDALERRDIDTMVVLLRLGVDTKLRDVSEKTVLQVAAEIGFDEGVQILLAAGANIEAMQVFGTPLHLAAMKGHNTIVQTLLAAGANIEALRGLDSCTPLHLAAIEGHIAVVQTLLAAGANIKAKQFFGTPLHLAAMEGHNAVVQTLLAAGANIEALRRVGSSMHLHLVAWKRYNAAADIEAKQISETPLHLAVWMGHNAIVQTLVAAGANIEALWGSDSATPLHLAAVTGHDAVVETLLAEGANINNRSSNELTPLMHAAIKGHTTVVEALLRAGANIDALARGKSALQLASDNGHKQTVLVLCMAGALTSVGRLRNDAPVE